MPTTSERPPARSRSSCSNRSEGAFPVTDRTAGTALPPFEADSARAWNTPGHTRYRLPDTDVNKVLAARYTTSAPLTLTRAMLWDMEVRKAARPGTYIPYVVQAGSDRSWSHHHGDGG